MMYLAAIEQKKSNRRVALRVYEEVNLFYQKINSSQDGQDQFCVDPTLKSIAQSELSSGSTIDSSLPYSRSLQNDTLNVNISSSGIAFTCMEELKAGDNLLLRILFLSSMTAVMTSCKVIYCKPSNPYEINRHPYSIGAQFINITAEDTELLNQHVNTIRKKQFIIKGLITAFILSILSAPGHAWELLVGFLHHLLEIILHMLHLVFEFLEMGLDHVIEHHFHTGTHETQVVVFYTLITFGLVPLYFLGHKSLRAIARLKASVLLYGARKKSSWLYYWGQQNLLDKFKIVGIGCLAITGYIYLNL